VEFVNRTAFSTLCFSGLDLEDTEFRIVVLKVGYQLRRTEDPGRFVAEIAEQPAALCMKDEYYGEVNHSAVREESDLAHYKPRCDVVFRGSAHAPRAEPASQWEVGIRVVAPTSSLEVASVHRNVTTLLRLNPALQARNPERWAQPAPQARRPADPKGTHTVLLDKQLRVTGQRELLRYRSEWRLGKPQPATQVAMRWEHAFGGRCVVRNPRYRKDASEPAFLLNEACFSNPLGSGWTEQRYSEALNEAQLALPERLSAPQIEAIDRPFTRLVECCHPERIQPDDPDEFIGIVKDYGFNPENLGIVGRPWVPRLQLAGTYDEHWKKERWPGLPEGFDFGYWNCAPRDQQINALPPDSRIELWNLADPSLTSNGYLMVDLPEDWPFIHIHLHDGKCLPVPMMTDTLIVDTDAMMLTLTHRIAFLEKPDMDRVEVWLHRQLPR
jgi:hypothetical protein